MATYFNNLSQDDQPVSTAVNQGGGDSIVGTVNPTGGSGGKLDYTNFLKRKSGTATNQATTYGQQTQNPGPAPVSPSSPVTSNGKLSTAAPAVQAPPQPQSQSLGTAPTTPDPFAAMGGGYWTGQQWVPKDHPLAIAAQQAGQGYASNGTGQPQAPQATTSQGQSITPPYSGYTGAPVPPGSDVYQADNLGNTPFTTYNGSNINVDLPDAYRNGDITQATAYNGGATQDATKALLDRILANPDTMDAAAVSQQKEASKETAAKILEAQQQANGGSAAARGVYGGGGQGAANQQSEFDFGQGLIGGYRDIDQKALATNRGDELNALGASNTYLNSDASRQSQSTRDILATEQAREQAAQAAAASRLGVSNLDLSAQSAAAADNRAAADSHMTAEQAALDRAIKQAGLNQASSASGQSNYGQVLDAWNADQDRLATADQNTKSNATQNRSLDIQQELGQGGLSADANKLSEQGREFDKGYNLDFLNYLLNGELGRDSNALGWSTLDADRINKLLGQV